ncbi:DUF659 domain-containing protein [Aphis craccivora]|uniref:DUF659 domain-containing protein n=1 Tax=Aphis craccivora TaxID=307492 RepID=A0A6G0YPL2_APHCR|nr:DUF659 domain-containing protein [Aphis craccivora]
MFDGSIKLYIVKLKKISNTSALGYQVSTILQYLVQTNNLQFKTTAVDEKTDGERALLVDRPGEIFLLIPEVLEKANISTAARLFDKSMFLL